ncbi:MAG: Crp/Fnr family transcriptional regulator [Eubacteriales bacterium]
MQAEILNCALFRGMTPEEVASLLRCLQARQAFYPKNTMVFRMGEPISEVGVVLSGVVHVVREDFWGNRNILAEQLPGDLFGESYAGAGETLSDVSVIVDRDAEILFLQLSRLLHTCRDSCDFHARLIRNLLFILSEKNLRLSKKLGHMSKRTTRDKLLSYLSEQAHRAGGRQFTIPYNRTKLAEYLSVDRSAMWVELCRMREEGLLDFERNRFTLHELSH